MKIGDLLFPQRLGFRVVKRYVFRAQYQWGYTAETQDLIQFSYNGQIDPAFRHTGDRNRAAVFPAMSGIKDGNDSGNMG